MDMKKILKDTAVLLVITIISGFLLGIAYEVTAPVIAARKAEEKAASYRTLFTDAGSFVDCEDLLEEAAGVLSAAGRSEEITDVMAVLDASGNVIGYAMSISCIGNQGEIIVAYGYAVDGTSLGIEILTSSETAGLGSRASEPEFKDQFKNKNYDSFTLVKNGGNGEDEIDAISGATDTSTAVTGAVNAGIIFGRYCVENN